MASAAAYDDDYETDSELGVDSDVESNFDTSPAGQYYDSRDRAIAEASPGSRQTVSKAQEASQRSTTLTSRQQPSNPTWSEAEAPTSNMEPPPPDYESATASRPYVQPFGYEATGSSAYMLPSDHSHFQATSVSPQRPAHDQFQQQPSEPQSMSDPAPSRRRRPDEETGLLTGFKGKMSRRDRRLCFRKLTVCNVLLAIVVAVIVLLFLGASDNASENGSDGDSDKVDPSPNNPTSPALPPEAPIPSSPECPYEYYSETTRFSFSSISNFSFVELMESSDWIAGGIKGTVNVEPGLQNQSEDVRLSLTYATTKPWMWMASNFQKTEDSMVLQLPNLQKTKAGYGRRPCMWVYVKIEVRPGVRLNEWELVTGNLDINVDEGLFSRVEGTEDLSIFEISGSSTLNAIRGNIQAAYWSSRETRIDVISGSIKGDFALRDLLSLKSQSGSIDVVVDPKRSDPTHTKPAEYTAQSRSGSIKSHFPTSGSIPQREYITRIEAQSSSISGSYPLGSLSSFHTSSGSITLDLLPKFNRTQPSTLHTDTRSGHTKIRVLTPHDYPGEPWSEAHTSHKTTSTSGSIDVVYPQEWSGYIEGETISGSIEVRGKGVEVVSDVHKGPLFRHLVARKGVDGRGSVWAKSTSGSLKVRVGEL